MGFASHRRRMAWFGKSCPIIPFVPFDPMEFLPN